MTSVNTLGNFGIPTGDDGSRSRMVQPKVKFKFRVRVFGFGPVATPLDLTANVQSVGRPERDNEEVSVHSYNSVAYFQGKGSWHPINLVVRDDVTNAVTKLVSHQEQKQMNHFEQTTPLAGSNYKFDMIVETMDGNNAVLETWYFENCWLQSINWGDFDYTETGGFLTIQMSVRFDNATQEDGLMTNSPENTSGIFI